MVNLITILSPSTKASISLDLPGQISSLRFVRLGFLICLVTANLIVVEGSWFSASKEVTSTEKQENIYNNDVSLDEIVSPIVNREIQTSVVAHDWPSSPHNVLCEAYAYHFPVDTEDDDEVSQNDPPRDVSNSGNVHAGNEYLENLVEFITNRSSVTVQTYSDAIELALKATTEKKIQQKNLLRYSLTLRANSPLCELHRGLAREVLMSFQINQMTSDAVVVLYPAGIVLVVTDEFSRVLESVSMIGGLIDDVENDPVIRELLLPGEIPIGNIEAGTGTKFAILYANLGTTTFAQTYKLLMAQSNMQFVVRHLGQVYYEEEKLNFPEESTPVILQGYGVRLDIRNVEYKVFDDRSDGKNSGDTNSNGLLNLSMAFSESNLVQKNESQASPLVSPINQFLGGVNLTRVLTEENVENVVELEKTLWKIHDSHIIRTQIIPPVWQRRRLPLQAAAAIVAAKDPLLALQEISQNLPSVASTLVHLKIPSTVHKTAKSIEDYLGKKVAQIQPGLLYLNGRAVNVERPSFNMFELLNVIRHEQKLLASIERMIGPCIRSIDKNQSIHALQQVQKAWMMGKAFLSSMDQNDNVVGMFDSDFGQPVDVSTFRIDVGRGWKGAVMYLNDVEKDFNYWKWSKSVHQALMNMQFGMPPSVRRNLFTMLAIFDPLLNRENNGYALATQLIKGKYPARLGILIVNEEDLAQCTKYSIENGVEEESPCPVPLRIVKQGTKVEDLKDFPVTTQALHRVVSNAAKESSAMPGAFSAYVEFMFQTLDNFKGGVFTLHDLVVMHGQMMTVIHRWDEDVGIEHGLEILIEKEVANPDEILSTYGGSLRFALNKGLKPGMSFLNGRPLPSGEENADDVGAIFGQEQQHVFGMIMNGEITDNKPKSVYATLLSGDRVFKKNHPLLATATGSSYAQVVQKSESVQFPFFLSESVPFAAETNFLIDFYVAFETAEGLELALKLITILDALPLTLENGTAGSTTIGLTYRLLPSTLSAAADPMCSVFAHASLLGSDTGSSLKSFIEEYITLRSVDNAATSNELLGIALKDVDSDVKDKILAQANSCTRINYPKGGNTNVIIANGRLFVPEGTSVEKDDIDLLLSMEMKRANAVTRLLQDYVQFQQPSDMEIISQTAAFLASSEMSSGVERTYLKGIIDMLYEEPEMDKENVLHLSWNTNKTSDDDSLQLEAAIFLNPVTESAQRVSPILIFLRDQLQVELHVILAPPTEIDGDTKMPITSYYRLVADPKALQDVLPPKAIFSHLPSNHVLTIRVDVPEPWNIQQTAAIQDTDNLLCDIRTGCGDEAISSKTTTTDLPMFQQSHLTKVEFGLKNLLIFGQCYETTKGSPPNGLQLTVSRKMHVERPDDVEVGMDGTIGSDSVADSAKTGKSDTLVMKNVGYWQLRANPGIWELSIAEKSRGAEIFEMIDGLVNGGRIKENNSVSAGHSSKTLYIKDFVNHGELLLVKRREGFETASLFDSEVIKDEKEKQSSEVINVFSLATGHLYERFLKIMMLSVTKRTSSKVKFWLFENFLSPTFKSTAKAMAERIGCEVEYVTYKWPEWLRGQTEKQRIIWGYKILFLDVLFPLDVKKIIYVDADQVVRGDLKELWDMDLGGAPYGYTPFCTSRESTLGYQFWRDGFWKNHLQGKPYHISALYVVDLERFRRTLVGDQLRSIYQQLSADPNSLSNLDQDLPNYAQHQVPIFSLPQDWLWCESWCSDETKNTSKTIDLCNNPEHKEPKVSMAKRIISGSLFNESWVELDAEVEGYEKDYLLLLDATRAS